MHNDKMGEAEHQSCPYQRFDRIIGETGKILFEIVGIATEMTHERGIDILQAPTRDHSIIARDEKTREHTEITHILPCTATRDSAVCPCRVGLRMATNNKLIDYAGQAQQHHAEDIEEDEGSATVFASHIRETPDVAQTHCRPSRGQDNTYSTTEICSFYLCHIILFL